MTTLHTSLAAKTNISYNSHFHLYLYFFEAFLINQTCFLAPTEAQGVKMSCVCVCMCASVTFLKRTLKRSFRELKIAWQRYSHFEKTLEGFSDIQWAPKLATPDFMDRGHLGSLFVCVLYAFSDSSFIRSS